MQKLKLLKAELQNSREELSRSLAGIDFVAKLADLEDCRRQMAEPDFWQKDQTKAKAVAQEKSRLEKIIQPWQKLQSDFDALNGLMTDMAAQQPSDEAVEEVAVLHRDYVASFGRLQRQSRTSGPYDDKEVILGIFAGAGGRDAQDWVQMLLRMYLRWAEDQRIKTELISQSKGEDAGLKSVSLYMHREGLYGRLKSEHGVHRLVRQSPFNAQNLRQTSFARVEVMPALEEAAAVELAEADLRFDFYRSSGHGGQSVNKTDSAVRVTHLPTKLVVAIQNERSQWQNKALALTVLRSKLAQMQAEQQAKTWSELKGADLANEWGNQIRNYVLHPYKQVKDLRTSVTVTDAQKVLDGDLDDFIEN